MEDVTLNQEAASAPLSFLDITFMNEVESMPHFVCWKLPWVY